jgi:1,2-diacylglycerol 3-alpha-glucosyltransferase
MTFALSLLTHLRTEAIDILHVQDPLVALIVQRARGIGLVRTLTILGHGTSEPYDFLQKIVYLQHLAPHHLDEARKAGFWKPTWTAIPNFVDIDLFRPGRADALRAELGIPDDAIVLLAAAAIKRDHKRIDYLLDEFARFMRINPRLPARLVVAGGREADTDDLVQQGRKTLGDRVCFQVQYPRDRMPELYRLADVFALCSLSEMMPIALIEATASGLPCLVHRDPVCEWIAGPGGKSIDMSATGALATALQPLFDDAGRRRTHAQLARQHCVENFCQGRVVDQIIDYYRFVLSNHRSRPKTESVAAGAGAVLSGKVDHSVDHTRSAFGNGNVQMSVFQPNPWSQTGARNSL